MHPGDLNLCCSLRLVKPGHQTCPWHTVCRDRCSRASAPRQSCEAYISELRTIPLLGTGPSSCTGQPSGCHLD